MSECKKNWYEETRHQITPSMHMLNNENLTKIFSYLSIKERIKCERVCKRWRLMSRLSWQHFKFLNANKKLWGFKLFRRKYSAKQVTVVRKTLERCGRYLTHIDLSIDDLEADDYIDDNILIEVGMLCPNIQSLNAVDSCLTQPALLALIKNCTNIREFVINSHTEDCTDDHFSKLFLQNKSLECLQIDENAYLNGICLRSLPKDSIQTIVLKNSDQMDIASISERLRHLKKLHTLDLSDDMTRDDICKARINKLPKGLKVLKLCNYENVNYRMILTLSHLQTLDLTSANIDDVFLQKLAGHCAELRTLVLDECYAITDVGIGSISALANLKELSFGARYCSYLNQPPPFINITDISLIQKPNLRKLMCFWISNLKENGVIELIEKCYSLEILNLSGCERITKKLVKRAEKAMKYRNNNTTLKLIVADTSINQSQFKFASEFLELIFENTCVDYSYVYKPFRRMDM